MTSLQQGATTQYNLGPVKDYVENAAYLLGGMFGITSIGGWRQSDPFPDHPSGHALDFMTNTGDDLANYAVAHADQLAVKYVIWNRRVWTRAQGWHPYTSTSNPHTDHVHITFLDTAGTWTATRAAGALAIGRAATGTSAATTGDTCAWKLSANLSPLPGDTGYCVASKIQVRALFGGILIAAGGTLVVVAIILLTRYGMTTKAGSAVTSAVRTFT